MHLGLVRTVTGAATTGVRICSLDLYRCTVPHIRHGRDGRGAIPPDPRGTGGLLPGGMAPHKIAHA